MPKIKVYEHDYEWTGQENKPKGVNIQEKHPWNKPNWGENPVGQSHSATSYDLHPDRFDMDELQRRHQWETPQWATVKGRCENMNRDVISDPIPKPMLKTTGSSGSPGKNGSTSADIRNKTRKPDEMDKEIADMKRQIEEVKQKKEALMKQKQEEDEHERTKHTIKESKIEKARRLAKEREDARWRATLAEQTSGIKKRESKHVLLRYDRVTLHRHLRITHGKKRDTNKSRDIRNEYNTRH